MKAIKKNVLMTIGLLTVASICLPIFTLAVEPLGYPPEWIVATDARITKGTEHSGDYENTYYYDLSYHTILSDIGGFWGPWEAIVYYSFGRFKCSRVKIYAMLDPLHHGYPFQAWACYEGEGETYLGYFNPQETKYFNLNSGKYLVEIKIRYYLSWGLWPIDRYVKIDLIRVLTTGHP